VPRQAAGANVWKAALSWTTGDVMRLLAALSRRTVPRRFPVTDAMILAALPD